ncbi:type VII secretion-associated serine protease mycosin [Nocardia terpenica]|uniref:type VII secretion-associated serine protease mycosin n=1 Tax=Nocardia terpenica TaxID=455432 RepID=UPI001892DA76|nr:type VII secretion-associated serine protease mycosin [Nocardia terpenica]MBF6061738.1 type VII secretion-associated serine protease mycosin [Nocardia terpenica]MBF6107467.1 type VII secretion-associated serine protease mycosin [Nocardia terpenica]MBF6110158.1 type VII secretion-associated serine protease mycosin [Nocardia terpenica]MBF6122330.1 type VII secretion-associated serine protease mycosin [Nocardia terpenica]MBF6151494.1 type VII secretion-associated serine protease mycosin [Nocar
MNPNRFGHRVFRAVCATALVGMTVSTGVGVAVADRPPAVNPGMLPSGPDGPPYAAEQRSNVGCAGTAYGGDGPSIPPAQSALNIDKAWQFSKGDGQLVAVIDTGVARNPRLNLVGGGDYITNTDGTDDCDAHGTFVAGIIAASQVDGQGFAGVAPDARILSIRQTSGYFQPKGTSQTQEPDAMPAGFGNTTSLAWAIRKAVDMHATVINMSEVACKANPPGIDDLAVGAAVRYASEHDVVVVAAAGNTDKDCKQATNTVQDPLNPNADPWSKVTMEVSPARYDDYVLSVGSVNLNGQASKFTVPGPWLGVAAPGENLISLDPRFDNGQSRGTARGKIDPQGQQEPISGTSFAAPYVAGVAALVRSRFPQLTAPEVIKRIEATAHAPAEGWNPYVGYGIVDPVAALTAEVPANLPPKQPNPARSWQLPVPATPPPPDHTARNVALIGTGIIGVLLVLGYLASFPIRRRFGVREDI